MSTASSSFDSTLGAACIGFNVSCVVFGVFTTQVFVYFQRYPADRLLYKLLVVFLWSMELFDQICIGHAVYFYSVENYGNPTRLSGNVVWTLIVQITLGCLVGTIVKFAFVIRVWRFSNRNVFVTGGIVLLILAQLGLGLVYTVRAFQLNRLTAAGELKVVATLSLGAGLVTDTVISAALCYFLQKLRTGFKKSDTLVNRLCIYAINTGVLTSAVSLCTLVLYNTHPEAFYFMASYFVLGKLYAISFLATLNTRKVIRGKGTDRDGSSGSYRNTFFMVTPTGCPPRTFPNTTHTKSVEIDVRQEISVITDIEEGDVEGSKSTGDLSYSTPHEKRR